MPAHPGPRGFAHGRARGNSLSGLCPSQSGHAPSSAWQVDPARPTPGRGPSSRLWELYLGSLKGDFSKRRQNKSPAPQGNRGERARLMHAH